MKTTILVVCLLFAGCTWGPVTAEVGAFGFSAAVIVPARRVAVTVPIPKTGDPVEISEKEQDIQLANNAGVIRVPPVSKAATLVIPEQTVTAPASDVATAVPLSKPPTIK